MSELIPIHTRVTHFNGGPDTHGQGTIVGHNGRPVNEYFKEKLESAAQLADSVGMLDALVDSLYDGIRCPYVVLWDNGYKDVYEKESINKL